MICEFRFAKSNLGIWVGRHVQIGRRVRFWLVTIENAYSTLNDCILVYITNESNECIYRQIRGKEAICGCRATSIVANHVEPERQAAASTECGTRTRNN